MPFHPFRLRSTPLSALPMDDSDDSSPECDKPCIVRVSAAKNGRKSGDRLRTIPNDGRGAATMLRESTHIALTLDKTHPDRQSRRPSKSGVTSVTHPTDALQPTAKQNLIRRVTSKLTIAILPKSDAQLRSRPPTRTLPTELSPAQGPRFRTPTVPVPQTLPNSFVSKQHREAALRERGLLPPHKDLSEQEREADARIACVPTPTSVTCAGTTEAERFKADWLSINRTLEGSNSEHASSAPPRSSSCSIPPHVAGTDLPPPSAGRPSFCSSVPALSASLHLEILHEEPSEQGPITPPPPPHPARLPVIVSSSLDSPPSPILVESPISCTFSSHCPGSTLESQSQSSHGPPVPEKDHFRWPPSRRRTSDSADRLRKSARFSRLGTHSLTNLRRTVAGSLMIPSTATLSTGDHSSLSSAQAPRAAIDPTIHSIGSILREARDIKDAESRRLSELAFLD